MPGTQTITGAGDAFWSGFYAGIIKGYTLKEALTLGFAGSAYKLKDVGEFTVMDSPEDELRLAWKKGQLQCTLHIHLRTYQSNIEYVDQNGNMAVYRI